MAGYIFLAIVIAFAGGMACGVIIGRPPRER